MDTILKYLKWRGDISFKERSFNEVDALLCALLGYVEWDQIVDKEAVLLKDACKKYYQLYTKEKMLETYAYAPMIASMIEVLQDTPRYNTVTLKKYKAVFDTKKDVQFAAVTITLPDNSIYISYRGTDSSLLGWKEDFEMLYEDTISSQKLALEYLQEVYFDVFAKKNFLVRKFNKRNIYIGGHSKGANIAMYSAICCKEMQPYISHVYSFDGPGFSKAFYETHEYLGIIERITNFVPVSSIIGRLMEHKEKYVILDGYASGLQQHDGFYWKVNRDNFVKTDSFNMDSEKIHKYIVEVLSSKTKEETKAFITFIFKVLQDMKVNSITDFTDISLKAGIQGIKELSTMNQEERKFFFELSKFAFSQTKSILSVMTNKSKDTIES